MRVTEKQLAEIQKRFSGQVREHRIARPCEEQPAQFKESKYHNRRTEVQGLEFDSAKEAKRYQELRLMELANEIADLKHHVVFNLVVNGMLICKYEADFVYTDKHGKVVEDAKGYRTQMYRFKKRLMKAVLGIEIKET